MNPYQPPESTNDVPAGRWALILFLGIAAAFGSWIAMLSASEPAPTLPPTTVLPPGQVVAQSITNVYLSYVWASFGLCAVSWFLFVLVVRQPPLRSLKLPWIVFVTGAMLVAVYPSAVYLIRGLPISF